jgi:hypothetical protein
MNSIVVATLVLVALCCTHQSARAETVESCKTCREYNVACLRNHSAAACKGEYEICMKHCREK